jgi:hypothetical protein
MKNEIYIEGIGWVKEITINRLNESGVNEPYTIYESITK